MLYVLKQDWTLTNLCICVIQDNARKQLQKRISSAYTKVIVNIFYSLIYFSHQSFMDIKTISHQQWNTSTWSSRPTTLKDFVWQEDCKKVIQAAITSSQTNDTALGHILFSGESWYGKTTLSWIIAHEIHAQIKVITWYALSKPADMVSVLNALGKHDILFIDEIHRLRPSVEEVLYIAMEDYRIDMVMPDGGSLSIPLEPFTLVGATTQLEKLSTPLKNRFVYKFHFQDYNESEKQAIIARYLWENNIQISSEILLPQISEYISSVPRDIATACIQLKDYLVAHYEGELLLDQERWMHFWQWRKLDKWWITFLHQKYLHILKEADYNPVWLKTLSVKLWMSEQSVEDDIEPLLFKLGKIDKTTRGRIIV